MSNTVGVIGIVCVTLSLAFGFLARKEQNHAIAALQKELDHHRTNTAKPIVPMTTIAQTASRIRTPHIITLPRGKHAFRVMATDRLDAITSFGATVWTMAEWEEAKKLSQDTSNACVRIEAELLDMTRDVP